MFKWLLGSLGLISVAFADTSIHAPATAHQSAQGGLMSMLPMIIIFVIAVYFLMIRPQQKRSKEQKELESSMKVGDEVVTTSGLIGKVAKITDQFITLSVSGSVELTFQKQAVVTILPKGTIAE
jgi:preprotein translocase subunit YajC